MGNNNFMKIFAIFAWLAFAAASCWATTESLFLSFSSGATFPRWVWWIIVIGFYVLTSLGTKWIVDGVSENYSEHKTLKLFGGLFVVILFWFVISMPTNAHTLLYKKAAKPVAQKEITYLEGRLQTIIDEDALIAEKQVEHDKTLLRLDQLTESLIDEIKTEWRKGVGGKAEGYLLDIERLLGLNVNDIPRVYNRNNGDTEISNCVRHYQNAIKRQKDIYEENFAKELIRLASEHDEKVAKASSAKKSLEAVYLALNDESVRQEDVLSEARKQINNAYDQLQNYTTPGATSSRERYVIEEKGMPSNRLTNVKEVVWDDYLHGKLDTSYDMPELKGLIYYIILSILVDLAAFLFFNIGFKKEEY
ncbi:MAG: hypothetical protein IJT74_01620 [Bacteroidales bacterium]|nr:hypothetical protein [Bacteroidales bacterium]